MGGPSRTEVQAAMKREEGSCILSFLSVRPQGRACPGRGYKKQGPFYSYGPCEGGSRHRGFHWGQREERLPVWAVTSWRPFLCSLLPSRLEPAGVHLQEACLGWMRSWRSPVPWPSSSSSTGTKTCPITLVRLEVAGTGLALHSWKDPVCHVACLGLRAGLDSRRQGYIGYAPTLHLRI